MFDTVIGSGSAVEAALLDAYPRPAGTPADILTAEHWAWLGDLELEFSGLVQSATGSGSSTSGSRSLETASDEPLSPECTSREPLSPEPLSPEQVFSRRAADLQAGFDSDAALLDTARAATADMARAQAGRVRALAAFAARRPSSLDRPDSDIGAAARASRAARPETLRAVSEFCVDEVAVALSMNPHAAGTLLVQAVQLVDRLPVTLAALEAGQISWSHVLVACELIAPLAPDARRAAEERLVPRAVGRAPSSWRPMVRRLVMKLDAEAIQARVAEAVRLRKVVVHPAPDGMATLSATLPAPVARAVEDALRQHATAARVPGDERTQGERMADCLVDLLLDPGGHGMTPVQAQLTIVATVRTLLGGDDPGEVSGDVVPASVVRDLATALGLLPADAAEAPSRRPSPSPAQCPTEPPPTAGPPCDPPGSSAAPAQDSRGAKLAELLATRDLRGTALSARPRVALVDERTGELAALTDAAGLGIATRQGRGLGPPPGAPGYRPTAALQAFVRLRDRRCQFPGCRARPSVCDLDHQQPWLAGGATAHDNLCGLCRHHHRLSHQAPGWSLRRTEDRAGLVWTSPTGEVTVVRPPMTGRDDDLSPDDRYPDDRPPATRRSDNRPSDGRPPDPTGERRSTGAARTPAYDPPPF